MARGLTSHAPFYFLQICVTKRKLLRLENPCNAGKYYMTPEREELDNMDYGMIGKIEKAKRYAEERERIQFVSFRTTIAGTNNTHQVAFNNGVWECDCNFFLSRGVCSHTMALERILIDMLPEAVETS
jgi:hypothetical protein